MIKDWWFLRCPIGQSFPRTIRLHRTSVNQQVNLFWIQLHSSEQVTYLLSVWHQVAEVDGRGNSQTRSLSVRCCCACHFNQRVVGIVESEYRAHSNVTKCQRLTDSCYGTADVSFEYADEWQRTTVHGDDHAVRHVFHCVLTEGLQQVSEFEVGHDLHHRPDLSLNFPRRVPQRMKLACLALQAGRAPFKPFGSKLKRGRESVSVAWLNCVQPHGRARPTHSDTSCVAAAN